jgi:hypothetical protein
LEESDKTMSGNNKDWGYFDNEFGAPSKRVLPSNDAKAPARQTKQLGRSVPRNQQVEEEWSVSEIVALAFIVGVVTLCFVWGFLDILNTVVTKGLLK